MKKVALSMVLLAIGTLALGSLPGTIAEAGWGEARVNSSPLGRMIFGRLQGLKALKADLTVTDEQRQQIREVLVSYREEIRPQMNALRSAKTTLRDLVRSEGSTDEQIRAAAGVLGSEIADAAVLAAELRSEIAPILTDEQHARIDEFFDDNDSAVSQFMKEVSSEN